MSLDTPWLEVGEGPDREIKVDGYKLIKSAFSALKGLVTSNPVDGVAAASDLVAAIAVNPTPQAIASKMLRAAMENAIYSLLTEYKFEFEKPLPDEPTTSAWYAKKAVTRAKTYLNKDLFVKPHHLGIVQEAQASLKWWLEHEKVDPKDVARVVNRLPVKFLYAWVKEHQKHPAETKRLAEIINTPGMPAAEQEFLWDNYRLHLINEFEAEPIFDETFGLGSVYIPLRAYTETTEKAQGEPDKKVRRWADLETTITDWLEESDKNDALRILSGGPGSGKSSFGKKLASRLAEEGKYVVFLPLHRVNDVDKLVPKIGEHLKRAHGFQHNPADYNAIQPLLILILDGLDEIASQGKVALESAKTFVDELKHYLRDRNTTGLRVKAIVAGRELFIQMHVRGAMTDGSLLHLLPYLAPKPENELTVYEPPFEKLVDQRDDWWTKFFEVKRRSETKMPESLKELEKLSEITAQPILNYLVALSYLRGQLKFDESTRVNSVYQDILEAVYKRVWGDKNHLATGLAEEDFIELLEEVAVAAWHGDGRTTTLTAIESRCDPSQLEKFEEGAEKGLVRLLLAFFAKRSEGTREPTFEFTHKSFGEYLVARRIVREAESLCETLEPPARKSGAWRNPEEEALIGWALVCGPTAMTHEIADFLRDEMHLRGDVEAMQSALTRCIDYVLANGMPMHHSELGVKSYLEMDRQARNAEEALLVVVNACARVTTQTITIAWSEKDADGKWADSGRAYEWIFRIVGQWDPGNAYPLAMTALSYLDLAGAYLTGANLFRANLDGANLERAILFRAILTGAYLTGANLSEADLTEADLTEADLTGANLLQADLSGAILTEADLSGAILTEADLTGAILSEANLPEANLSEADLTGANLTRANLPEANLSEADLTGANLTRANLLQADLSGAILTEANLLQAILTEANLTEANLSGANLTGANLTGANLSGAILTRAILTRAILTRATYCNDPECKTIWPAGFDPKAAGAIEVDRNGKPIAPPKLRE